MGNGIGAQGNSLKLLLSTVVLTKTCIWTCTNGAVTPGTAIVAGTKSAHPPWMLPQEECLSSDTTGGAWTPSANGGDVLEDGTPDVDISSVKVWQRARSFHWSQGNQIAPRPGTSPYAADRGGAFDEMP